MARKKIKFIEMQGNEVPVREDQIIEFQTAIERIVRQDGIGYIEAVQEYCEMNEIEVDTIKNLLSASLKEKIEHEATQLRLLKGASRRSPQSVNVDTALFAGNG